MRPNLKLYAGSFWLLLSLHAYGQEDCQNLQSTLNISLPQALTLAVCNNPQLEASRLGTEIQKETTKQVLADTYPQLTGAVTTNSTYLDQRPSQGQSTNSRSTAANLNLVYTLYDFGLTETNLKKSKILEEAANYSYNAAYQAVLQTTTAAYISAFLAKETTQNQLKSKITADRLVKVAETKFELGLVPMLDVLTAKTEQSKTNLAILKAQSEENSSLKKLAILLGLPVDKPISLAATIQPSAITLGSVSNYLKQAETNRPELQQLLKEQESATLQIDAIAQGNKPKLTAGFLASTVQSDPGSITKNAGTFQLSLSVPLFDGYKTDSAISSAWLGLDQKRQATIQKEREITQEVITAYEAHKVAIASRPYAEQAMQLATKTRELAEGSYQEGVGTVLDVLKAQDAENGTRTELVAVTLSILTTKFNLLKAIGILSKDEAKERP